MVSVMDFLLFWRGFQERGCFWAEVGPGLAGAEAALAAACTRAKRASVSARAWRAMGRPGSRSMQSRTTAETVVSLRAAQARASR